MDKKTDKSIKLHIIVEGTDYGPLAISLDSSTSIKEVICRIIDYYNLPEFDNGKNPIQYLLGQIMDEGGEPEVLESEDENGNEQVLEDYNIQDNSTLHLISIPIAGGSGSNEVSYVDVDSDSSSDLVLYNEAPPRDYYPSPDQPSISKQSISNYLEDQLSCDNSISYGLRETQMNFWSGYFNKLKRLFSKSEKLYASSYAPAEISPRKDFIIRVYVHRKEDASEIDSTVKELDFTAKKKANKTLNISVKNGDKISVMLRMTDGMKINCPIQASQWKGEYIEYDFTCRFVDIFDPTVWCKVLISVNDVPAGELSFILDIVYHEPKKIYAKASVRKFTKIFISYAHEDYSQVRGIAEGCKMNGSDYFFDRHSLKAGDIFKDKILEYIDNADLFVLCWSKNAAESEWVQIERKHALDLIKKGNHRLSIYPLSMPPEAPLPEDMSDKYNFATL